MQYIIAHLWCLGVSASSIKSYSVLENLLHTTVIRMSSQGHGDICCFRLILIQGRKKGKMS